MFRMEMSPSHHSSVSFDPDSIVRALLGSSRLRELRSLARRRCGWDTDFPFCGSARIASAVWPRLFSEFCFHVSGEFDAFRHSRFLFHIAPAGHVTT